MKLILIAALSCLFAIAYSQEMPSKGENLASLTTFGKAAPKYFGDDDHVQIFFVLIPKEYTKTAYLKVYDPEISGENDLDVGGFNTSTKFSIYGGKSCYSEKAARQINPKGNFKSGTLVLSKTFKNESEYNEKWINLATLNPKEGEYVEEFKGYVFKIVAEGLSGNDGNSYKYFLSSSENSNLEVPGGNGFTYEYSFRLKYEGNSIAHVYPYVDDKVDYIVQYNFDFDRDGTIQVYSSKKNGHVQLPSGDNEWNSSKIVIQKEERNNCIDIQLTKGSEGTNDMVFYALNQYNEPVPFFASPIGGTPKYIYSINVKKKVLDK